MQVILGPVFFGPVAPRALLFVKAIEVSAGKPAGPCEALVAQHTAEVDMVLSELGDLSKICNSLREMQVRIAARKLIDDIERGRDGRSQRADRADLADRTSKTTPEEIARRLCATSRIVRVAHWRCANALKKCCVRTQPSKV